MYKENPEECITEHVFNYNGYTKKLTISDVPQKEREQKEIDLSKKILKQDRRKIRCANYIVCI